MKKIVLFLIIGLFLTGCSSSPTIESNNANLFVLKEKCHQYLESEKESFTKENSHLQYVLLEYLAYSKTLNTCVAKWGWTSDVGRQFYEYRDVLIDKSLASFMPFKKNADGGIIVNNFKTNKEVEEESNLFENSLEITI